MIEEYRVLTLWQPWASLFVHNIKQIETRPLPTTWTKEKGIYLIHAAAKWGKVQNDICNEEPFRSALIRMHIFNGSTRGIGGSHRDNWELPLGVIIGVIEIINCLQIRINEPHKNHCVLSNGDEVINDEYLFGDYREGRYAWIGSNPRILQTPIPYKNGQGYYQKFKGDINDLKFIK